MPDKAVVDELEGRDKLLQTDQGDDLCRKSPAKIGRDADKKPGGCDNIIVTIAQGQVSADYFRTAD